MAGVKHYRQMGQLFYYRNGAHVNGVPCGCLEGSDASFAKYYIGLPSEIIYSAAINHSSMVAASPLFRSTGLLDIPTSLSS